jgi:hypothetical protein
MSYFVAPSKGTVDVRFPLVCCSRRFRNAFSFPQVENAIERPVSPDQRIVARALRVLVLWQDAGYSLHLWNPKFHLRVDPQVSSLPRPLGSHYSQYPLERGYGRIRVKGATRFQEW